MLCYASSNSQYRADIDGIRSLAVLSVVIYHLNPDWLPGGFLGVDVFFVVSGYLITSIILRENRLNKFSFKNFYARRIKRIFPALFSLLFLTATVATFLLHPQTYVNFMKSARYSAVQLANFFFSRKVDYFEEGFSEQPLLHIWTLGVEEQFYLFWPLFIVFLFWIFAKRNSQGSTRISFNFFSTSNKFLKNSSIITDQDNNINIAVAFTSLSIISFISCYILAETDHKIAFYMFYTRAWEFCIGGFVALDMLHTPVSKISNTIISLIGMFLLLMSFLIVDEEFLNISFLQFGVIIPCIGTALLIFTDGNSGLANKILSTKVPVFIGKISYSLYLYHWPIIIFHRNLTNSSEISLSASIVIIIVSIILATISYYLIEQPARKTKIIDTYVIASAILAIIVFTIGFKTLEGHDTSSWRIKEYTAGKRGQFSALPPQCVTKTKGSVKYKECLTSKKQNLPYVALVGDSHTIHFLKATVTWAKESNHHVVYLSAPGCPMLLGNIDIGSNGDAELVSRCAEALPFFQEEIVNNEKVTNIFLAQRFDLHHNGTSYMTNNQMMYYFKDSSGKKVTDHTTYFRDQLVATSTKIRESEKYLVILKQVPLFPGNKDCDWEPHLKKYLSKENSCSYDTDFIKKWQKPSMDFIDEFIGDQQLGSFDPLLYLDQPRKKNRNLYGDIDHLNGNGCHFLVPHFVTAMNNLADTR